jgi:hypothetical protein
LAYGKPPCLDVESIFLDVENHITSHLKLEAVDDEATVAETSNTYPTAAYEI